jgi:hypothetical protein
MITEILEQIIKKLYDVENCAGDWKAICIEGDAKECIVCCKGIELLEKLKEAKRQESIRKVLKGDLF